VPLPFIRKRGTATRSPAPASTVRWLRSYWPGLFHCYDVPELPRTDNDLEQLLGSHRYHERRASGRKVASPGKDPLPPWIECANQRPLSSV